ncbi:hypothetical protein TrVFT333_009321 [Trichoderma virens FT-333]|nr:hypothetical protein TrVFT333_009321 [Trichoderma virens FT-333]
MPSLSFTAALGLLSLLPAAQAGWNQNSNNNIVVYWGQNSGSVGQNRLSYYCQNAPDVDVINISFMVGITNLNLNLANVGNNCTSFPQAPNLLNCPQVAADIVECQQTYGKTIMMSLFGSTYSESGFSSSSAAVSAAQEIWAMYGPVQSGNSTPRPFGNAVVDGFDFDLEDPIENNMEPFAAELKTLMNANTSKKFYLSVAFDWVNVQFYNNGCGVSHYPTDFNWATWDNWAKTVSANKNAKVLIGTPANVGGANAGSFPTDSQLSGAINLAKGSSSFGGVMLWDMAQLFSNTGYLAKIVADLGAPDLPLLLPLAAMAAQSPNGASAVVTDTQAQPSAKLLSSVSWNRSGGLRASKGPSGLRIDFYASSALEVRI